MSKPGRIYRRLPGRRSDWVTTIGLYAGPDHLLLVNSTGTSEAYRRFYYRHLQAVVLQRTSAYVLYSMAFGGTAFLFLLFALAAGGVSSAILGGLAALCLLLLVYNLLKGPTCRVYFRTAVQTERIPTLTRVRTARRCLQRIRPLITQAQGTLAGEPESSHARAASLQLSNRSEPAVSAANDPARSASSPGPDEASPPVSGV